MSQEMKLLRNALDARGIKWRDGSTDNDRSFPFLNMMIYRTKYIFHDKEWSVICGIGTFGSDKGLLELSVEGMDGTIGSLSASTILKMMDEDKT